MITEELLQFMRTQLSAGETRESITTKLVTEGNWSEGDVDKAFSMLSESAVPKDPTSMSSGAPSGVASFGAPSQGGDIQQDGQVQGGGQQKRTTPLLPLLMVGAVLMIGVVLFVLFGSSIGGHRAATTIDGFIADFIKGAEKIEKFEYEVTLNVAQEEKDGSVEPLTVTDPTYETRIEAVERDLELYDTYRNIRGELRRYEWDDKPYPASMSALPLDSPVPLDTFTYRQLSGGTDYELTVRFETDEMMTYLYESYEDYKTSYARESNGGVLDRDAHTITATSESTNSFYPSTASLLPKSPVVLSVEAMSMYAQFLPARFQSDVTFSGVVGLEQEKGKIPDTENALAVNVDWGDASFAVDAGLIVKDEEIYGQVNRFPSLFFFDIEPIRGKWINISRDDAEDSLMGLFNFTQAEEDEEAFSKIPKILAETISEHNPFILKGKPRAEELEGGGEAIAYSLGINRENVAPFSEALYREITPLLLEEEELESMNAEVERALEFFATEEFTKVVDYMNEHATFEIWMDKSTGYPVQYVQELVFVPNPEALDESAMFFASSSGAKNTQLRMTSTTRLTNINKNIDVQVPKDALTLDEAADLIFGEGYSEETDNASIRSTLNSMRSYAEIHKDDVGSYSAFCSSGEDFGVSINLKLLNAEVPTAKAVCSDSATAWAAEATLSDGTYWCVDSTGVATESNVARLPGAQSCR